MNGSLGYAAGGAVWLPVQSGDDSDGWAVFTPIMPYGQSEQITITVDAATTEGDAVGPLQYTFTVGMESLETSLTNAALVQDAEGRMRSISRTECRE